MSTEFQMVDNDYMKVAAKVGFNETREFIAGRVEAQADGNIVTVEQANYGGGMVVYIQAGEEKLTVHVFGPDDAGKPRITFG